MLITLTGDPIRQALFQRLQDAGGLAARVAPDAFDLVICFGEGPVRETPPDLDAGQGWSQATCLAAFKEHFRSLPRGTLVPVFHDPWAGLSDISEHSERPHFSGQWFVHGGRPHRLPDKDDDFPIERWCRGAVSWLNIVYFLERGPLPAGIPAGQLDASREISPDLARDLESRIAWVFATAFDNESWVGARLSKR